MTSSVRGYTTATKVKAVLAGKVNGNFTDAVIEDAISRIEGWIDTKLRITSSTNIVGANTLSWTGSFAPHWVIEGAATYGAALQLCGPSIASWNTLDQLVNTQNELSYFFKLFADLIEDGSPKDSGDADFITGL